MTIAAVSDIERAPRNIATTGSNSIVRPVPWVTSALASLVWMVTSASAQTPVPLPDVGFEPPATPYEPPFTPQWLPTSPPVPNVNAGGQADTAFVTTLSALHRMYQ